MAEVSTEGDKFVLAFSQQEFNELGLEPGKEYKVVKVENGIWVVLEKGVKKENADHTEENIIAILKKKALRDRVEGMFEKFLNEKELKKFNELLQEGKIRKFKLSGKYTKAIYKSAEEIEKDQRMPQKKEKVYEEKERPFPEYSLKKDGFIVVKNEERARRLSEELKERIKKNEVKGIKSFDGNFYIIESDLYEKKVMELVNFLQEKKSAELNEISKELGLQDMLARVVIEFLKDEGSVIEKRKGFYQIV